MEPVTTVLIGTLIGALASLASSLLAKYLSDLRKKEITIKVGPAEIRFSGTAEDTANEIVTKILELQKHPQVFLSYSGTDGEFAKRLAQDLRSRGINVWIADENIQIGDSITGRIEEAVSASQWIVVLISENSLESSWLDKELDLALSEEKRRGRTLVLPVLYQGKTLPSKLEGKAFADFRQDYESGLRRLLTRLQPESHNAGQHS